MEQNQAVEQLYTSYRPLLFALAYRMMGSVMDAEDAVQEAFLNLNGSQLDSIRNTKAYLCRIVTNRCIDRLRSASKKREVYVGPWLPEPVVTEAEAGDSEEPAFRYMRHESISTAYMLLLQQLSWVERAVFILREVLEYEYEEIAAIVDKSPANCRQIFHRAKRAINGSESAPTLQQAALLQEQAGELTRQFVQALTTGNIAKLMSLLTEDAILLSDGGGKVTAAIRPILGADRITRFMAGLVEKVPADFSYKFANVNGRLGIVSYFGSQINNVISFQVQHNLITNVYIMVNPDKLSHLQP
ncbi:MAG: subfamily polymerase sigma-70 subunit [Paenibacillus sp.]|jgi:RNA polymerase sigma-70 factor (ECF subfamily)|nr:subfamily polymerase sigma-70 subunit [Paenibacillus sp.]